jgi:phosphatidylinositol alpha-1,6-mannosyltransferase
MRVLFVSKPVVAPFHDGATCLVRDLSTHLVDAQATVLTARGAVGPVGVEQEAIYPAAGGFAPGLRQNAHVLARLLAGSKHDVWNFVFAPNPKSSAAARLARAIRHVPTVQTVASAPRKWDPKLLFGDRIVCLSHHTRDRLVEAGARATRFAVIPPSVGEVTVSAEAREEALRAAGVEAGRGPVVVYPGDLEFSRGSLWVAQAAPSLVAAGAQVVFACRAKTNQARGVEEKLRRELAPLGSAVRFAGEVPSLPALLAASAAVLFPVDDLYGKVDLPYALLEAMALGIPVIALAAGPLRELEGAVRLDRGEDLGAVTRELLRDEEARRQQGERGRESVRRRHAPRAAAQAYEAVYRGLVG